MVFCHGYASTGLKYQALLLLILSYFAVSSNTFVKLVERNEELSDLFPTGRTIQPRLFSLCRQGHFGLCFRPARMGADSGKDEYPGNHFYRETTSGRGVLPRARGQTRFKRQTLPNGAFNGRRNRSDLCNKTRRLTTDIVQALRTRCLGTYDTATARNAGGQSTAYSGRRHWSHFAEFAIQDRHQERGK